MISFAGGNNNSVVIQSIFTAISAIVNNDLVNGINGT
jgi:hypothetical protein